MFLAILGGLASLAGFLFALNSARNRRKQISADSRFRALIESSRDVFTVITQDNIALVSPSLGPLSEFQNPNGQLLYDFLPTGPREIWQSADQRLADGDRPEHVELTIRRPDGSSLCLEAEGTKLDATAHERAWVWSDITAGKELEVQLTQLAFHDSLTGVANRSLLHDRVTHALQLSAQSNSSVVLLFCDLDEFKHINDSLGHDLGDELLRVVTKRVSGCLREADTLARLGGDEFAILLGNANKDKAMALAERLLSVVSFEVQLGGRTVFPSISIGIAESNSAMTTDELLRNADIAMYSAKRAGKGRAIVFEDQMHEDSSETLEMQLDLRDCVTNNQLLLHFQPTVTLATGVVEGVEALVRWNHPRFGLLLPDRFVGIAEANGMIVSIGRWVLQQACFAAVMLNGDSEDLLLMHVNLSPPQLNDPTIVATVSDALRAAGLDPEMLVLEITEGSLLDNANSINRLHELRALGVGIAIDDFGTGYASLSYLQQLPAQILKIDRSFVSGAALAPVERRAFLHAIVNLANSLGLRSVAEGIEDLEQCAELEALGCYAGQGFLWGQPQPLEAIRIAIRDINRAFVS
jgi:diguanylate cyclase (GGDEF)-like protein